MKKLILALALLATPAIAEDHVTIAIRTNQFDGPRMVKFFTDLAEHIAPKHLSDSYHGIKTKGHIKGGNWVAYTNTQGHVFMVNNFRKSELEKVTKTYQYGVDGEGNQIVTNTINHGKAVSQARLTEVRGNASQSALKMAISSSPRAKLTEWGLFAIRDEEDEL